MNDRDHWHARPLAVALLLATLGAGASARGQDDEDDEEAPKPAVVNRVNAFVMNDQQFDQWVFGNLGMGNAATARNKLESLLSLNVEEMDRGCRLTPAQKKKLLVAGRGDIKRFFDRIDAVRKKLVEVEKLNVQNQFQRIWQEIQPLQTTFQAGLFGENSIFGKALRGTLTPEQVKKHEEMEQDRLNYRYWARVDLAMELLNNEVGFTDDQRRQVVTLLREETRPPRRMGQNDYYVVLYQISRIPEAKLRPVFEDFQWRVLNRQLAQGRGMEAFLKQNGFLPEDARVDAND